MQSFASFDGVEIAYQQWGEPDGGRPPVVLHHGFIADANLNWVGPGVVDALVAAGRFVVAPDARGHGASGKPHDPAAYGESAMARDLGRLFDLMAASELDLVGYSMGAIVSLLTASEDPRVRRLVVGGVGSGVAELGGVDTRELAPELLVTALLAEDAAWITDPAAAGFRAFADAVGADRFALAAQAQAIRTEPIPLDQIKAPTLVLVGRDDRLATRPEVLVQAIPDATLRVVEGDHMRALADPSFAPAIVDFVAEP